MKLTKNYEFGALVAPCTARLDNELSISVFAIAFLIYIFLNVSWSLNSYLRPRISPNDYPEEK